MNNSFKFFALLAVVSATLQTHALFAKEVTPSRVSKCVTAIKSAFVNAPSAVKNSFVSTGNFLFVRPTKATVGFVTNHPIISASATLITLASVAAGLYAYKMHTEETAEDLE